MREFKIGDLVEVVNNFDDDFENVGVKIGDFGKILSFGRGSNSDDDAHIDFSESETAEDDKCWYVKLHNLRLKEDKPKKEEQDIKVSAESYHVESENFKMTAAQDAIYGEPDFWDCFDYNEAKPVLYVLKNIPRDKIDEFVAVVEKCIELKEG